MNISELVCMIETDVEKFLQDDSVFQLMAFLRGYCCARNAEMMRLENQLSQDHLVLESFGEHVRSKFGVINEHVSIEEKLTDAAGDRALNLFFDEWNGFLKTIH